MDYMKRGMGNPEYQERNIGPFATKKAAREYYDYHHKDHSTAEYKKKREYFGTSVRTVWYLVVRPRRGNPQNSTVRLAPAKPMSSTERALGRRQIPTSNPLDEHAATELKLYIDNDADLYRQRYTPIVKNMTRKKASGKYDRDAAVKGWMYLVDDGAKKYHREFGSGGKWHDMFDKPTREAVAREFRDEFEVEYNLGNYDEYIPKKYRKNPLNKTNRRWSGPYRGPRKTRKVSPQWWKITKYRKNGRVMGHHIGQGTVRQAKDEAAKLSEARGVHKTVLRGPFKKQPAR